MFEGLNTKVKIYRENTLEIWDTKHTYKMEVEKDKWYYISVRHDGTNDERAALNRIGQNFYLLNVELPRIRITSACIYCPPILAEPRIIRDNTTIDRATVNRIVGQWDATEFPDDIEDQS